MRRLFVAFWAVMAIAVGAWHLRAATSGLVVVHAKADGRIPVTVFRRAIGHGEPAPVVLIAHGFAGSQQLMLPFAVTLARNGYVAVTFDFPGHGRNPEPMLGFHASDAARNQQLLDTLTKVADFARALPGTGGRMAVLGHSMASDIVVRYAMAHPAVRGTVAVSMFSPAVTADAPRDLLVIDGALEPAMLTDEGYRVVGQSAGGAARERVTYGSFADGTARRLALAGGVEHIGVLYSGQSLKEALSWLDQVFGRSDPGGIKTDFIDARGPWLGLLFLGLVALAWPLARSLPRLAPDFLGGGLGWRRLLPIAVAPAVLTPLILWKLPTGFLPILLGDYLAVHFAVYGLLTAACLWGMRVKPPAGIGGGKLAVAVAGVAVYSIAAIGLPIDRFVTSFTPTHERWLLVPAVLVGTLPYFLADEWLTRGIGAARGGYAVTKICFVLSLALAVSLNPPRLFFLIIIIPVIVIFLTVYGLFSAWAYQRTRTPLVGALANSLAFAWAIAVTFPVMGR